MPTPVQEALGLILRDPNSRKKPCGVFGSFGWSGEAVDEIEQKLRDSGYKQAFKSIRCKFSPDAAMLQTCEESGTDLGQEVKRLIRKEVCETIHIISKPLYRSHFVWVSHVVLPPQNRRYLSNESLVHSLQWLL